MIDKLVIDEMWEFLYKIISGKASQQVPAKVPMGQVLGADSDDGEPKVRQILPPKQKPLSGMGFSFRQV